MTLFKNKYRIESNRLQSWDYSGEGAYLITICTHNRIHYFGEIEEAHCIAPLFQQCNAPQQYNPHMQLNELGKIVQSEWVKTIEMRPNMNLKIGEFIVMPNHFHAIIMIGGCGRDAMHCDSSPATAGGKRPKNKFGPQSKNLASIIRGFNHRLPHMQGKWETRNLNGKLITMKALFVMQNNLKIFQITF